MTNKYTKFLRTCTEEQKQILAIYAEENFNILDNYHTESRLCLDGSYSLRDLQILAKILENPEI